jgi:hypothetical protein
MPLDAADAKGTRRHERSHQKYRCDAGEPALWRQNPRRRRLPLAGGARQKALSHARWRTGIRRAKDKPERTQARPVHPGCNRRATADNRIHFLVETHSETLLNRLGELIGKGRILHSDIQVILFEATDDNSRITDVRTSSFGELGELENWPYGFFQPSVM